MCMIDHHGDHAIVYRALSMRARKSHVCDECRRQIGPGEQYNSFSGLQDGAWWHYCACAHCCVAIQWLMRNCGGVMHGAVMADIAEHVQEYPDLKAALSRLTIGARRYWRRFDGSGLMRLPPLPRDITV